MTYVADTYLRAEILNALTSAVPWMEGEENEERRREDVATAMHCLYRHLLWTHKVELWPYAESISGDGRKFDEIHEYFMVAGLNLSSSWDGEELSWSDAVESALRWIEERLNRRFEYEY